ncbi:MULTISPECIES: 3-hydroxyacyl-CoA dehydrogenase NAD-binding domain-containing protein [unclassified Amycolatopsis]|uniref:3-hydroxyacyl-CoA dehydrogenase NAD-binding domain-containing protein n=1 Tax=unclassified Amycolatopsis TaxID=2618356 RepID=UPI002875A370|nr:MULTISPECIES: 3-hydroxyacyl-CoA dehydrogenase NAD-binding domain-containing protein [unclassified Amycolatopsis]MDS0134534.1 hypothetical protein [Amycolatopsis sp. 505]MDS0147882.1 hypothetical protein [Amycolatopsis sp. CM201R]
MSGERLAVLGAGVMGTAIATPAAGHGLPVKVVEVDSGRLAAVGAEVRGRRGGVPARELPELAREGK